LQDRVTSVRAETGNEVAIEWWAPRIRTAVIEACERALHQPTAAWAAWRDLDESIGKHVSIERNGQRQNGVVKDVLVNGPLVVEINGAEVIVHGGEVRFVDEPPQPRWCPEDTVST
jgi:biotin-(acetyl-CoA carboxylase) ligase